MVFDSLDQQPAPAPMPIRHRFGDRAIVTAWRFSELPEDVGNSCAGTIHIELAQRLEALPTLDGCLHQWGDENDGVTLQLAKSAGRHLLSFSGLAGFELDFEHGSILVRALVGTDDNTLEHLLVDQVLPRFLAHQGEMLMHASALTLQDRTVLFLGESGWGKSTLAGLLHRAGHTLHSDDCVQVVQESGGYFARPTYPSLRLFTDSLDHAFPDAAGLTAVAGYSRKQRLPVPDTGSKVPPIAALYLLDEPSVDFDSVQIAPMRPVSACLELMRHSFKLDIGDRARTRQLFAACSELARAVPAFSLDYPRDYRSSDDLVRTVAAHVAGLPKTEPDKDHAHARR